jgi:hypothetical protein
MLDYRKNDGHNSINFFLLVMLYIAFSFYIDKTYPAAAESFKAVVSGSFNIQQDEQYMA